MLGYLILLFTVAPVIELALLIKIGGYIGVLNTVAVVVITGVAGAFAARTQGLSVMYRIRNTLNSGMMPGDEIIEGIIILCGGIMFLTPGFITDVLGFLMLIPFSRRVIQRVLKRKFRNMVDRGRIITMG